MRTASQSQQQQVSISINRRLDYLSDIPDSLINNSFI